MTNKYICIHGHFYQPPRENAWLEEIEIQESAAPWHDWNERISHECYLPNAVSRVLNTSNEIIDIVNNYASISFNFGPTLLSWMERYQPLVYQYILDADKQSMVQFNGHGSAMAQVYHHIIMPLANTRDKYTQIYWGIRDFEQRFGRKPEGMWLAETAVDTETLEILADNGIKYTVLAPDQAARYRKKGSDAWQNGIDTNQAYICQLPSSKTISLFFYNGKIAQGVAFGGLLNDGVSFAKELLNGFDVSVTEPQLVHIATDGETFGHHHKNGDMALASCIRSLRERPDVELINYSYYLEKCPPQYEVQIKENTSWSCVHGVERWKSNCGCHTGGSDNWNQEWRVGLREGLNWLRDQMAQVFDKLMRDYTSDPWAMRNDFIQVLMKRNEENIDALIKKHIGRELSPKEKTFVIRMLENQRHSMMMFTSCGWFFNDVSGIETIQILQYANRALQHMEGETDFRFENAFLDILNTSISNIPEEGSAKKIYELKVAPKRLSLTQVGMHYAVNTLFADAKRIMHILNYNCISERFESYIAGDQRLAIGTTLVKSKVTLSHKNFSFIILYLGGYNLLGNTTNDLSDETFDQLNLQIKEAFLNSDMSRLMDLIRQYFPDRSFSFLELFRDEQIRLLEKAIAINTNRLLPLYQLAYEENFGLLNIIHKLNLHIPDMMSKSLELILENRLQAIAGSEEMMMDISALSNIVGEITKWNIKINQERFNILFNTKINATLDRCRNCDEKSLFTNIMQAAGLLEKIEVKPTLSRFQDKVFQLMKAQSGNKDVADWLIEIARSLNIKWLE